MKNWLILIAAIAVEVAATLALKAALDNALWGLGAVTGYLGAFTLLSVLLRRGAPIGTIYGIWAASGVALTAIIAAILFDEPFTAFMAVGVALVVGGVILVETGTVAAAADSSTNGAP